MTNADWKALTLEQAEQKLLELLADPSFVDKIAYEPSLDVDDRPIKSDLFMSEDDCYELVVSSRLEGSSWGSFYNEGLTRQAIVAFIRNNLTDFANWLTTSIMPKKLSGSADQDIGFYYVRENDQINRYETNEFLLRFECDAEEVSECGFLIISVVVRKFD